MSAAPVAFHGDPALKARVLDGLAAHRAADEIVQGHYWQAGRGCAVGCVIHDLDPAAKPSDHKQWERLIGVPVAVAHLVDAIFEGLSESEAPDWSVRIIEAIPVGADLSDVYCKRHGMDSVVIDGLGYLCQRYNGALDEKVAVDRLSTVNGGVNGLLGKAELIRRQTGNPKGQCVAAAAVDIIASSTTSPATSTPSWPRGGGSTRPPRPSSTGRRHDRGDRGHVRRRHLRGVPLPDPARPAHVRSPLAARAPRRAAGRVCRCRLVAERRLQTQGPAPGAAGRDRHGGCAMTAPKPVPRVDRLAVWEVMFSHRHPDRTWRPTARRWVLCATAADAIRLAVEGHDDPDVSAVNKRTGNLHDNPPLIIDPNAFDTPRPDADTERWRRRALEAEADADRLSAAVDEFCGFVSAIGWQEIAGGARIAHDRAVSLREADPDVVLTAEAHEAAS